MGNGLVMLFHTYTLYIKYNISCSDYNSLRWNHH